MAKSTITDDPVSEQDKFMLRLPAGMRERIKVVAEKNNRSMNAEIVAALESAYPAATDVMHIHLDNIRKALEKYEKETDPRRRLYLQGMVEAMVTLGHNFEVEWDDEE